MNGTGSDSDFMLEALALAERGRYSVSPNPAVGCVIAKGGNIIARGWHARAGFDHAEVDALTKAGAQARGATAFVTLEPCNHHGRTGPCAQALIDAGVERVVYALDDPNQNVAGGGARRLREAGIAVTSGVCSDAAARLNRGFFQRMRNGRPRIRIKVAMSLDGRAALADGQSQWITGPAARADVQRLRAESCAIVTGIGTVLADDPSLNVRDQRFAMRGRQPIRIVLDSHLRMSPAASMLRLPGETRIFTLSDDVAGCCALEAAGARVERQPVEGARLDLALLVRRLGELEINEVLVEAGPTLAGQFIGVGCFDELIVHVAPKLLGRAARRALDVASPLKLDDARNFEMVASDRLGDDIALTLVPKYS